MEGHLQGTIYDDFSKFLQAQHTNKRTAVRVEVLAVAVVWAKGRFRIRTNPFGVGVRVRVRVRVSVRVGLGLGLGHKATGPNPSSQYTPTRSREDPTERSHYTNIVTTPKYNHNAMC